jgi:hypothetical protein
MVGCARFIRGAFCLVAEVGGLPEDEAFPNVLSLARIFERAIPALTAKQADEYAANLIAANDAGRFEEAWDVLGEMLEWQTAGDNT